MRLVTSVGCGKQGTGLSGVRKRSDIEQNLIKVTHPYEYVDVFWGLFVGIVQLEDIKSQARTENRYLKPTLQLAEKILIDAMASEPGHG